MGAIVAWFHDLSDIVTGILRVFIESEYTGITGFIGVIFPISWFYVRIYVFAYAIINIWTIPVYMVRTIP